MTDQSSAGTSLRANAVGKRLGPVLQRYRIMALITGGFLLLLCVEMIMKYFFNGGRPVLGNWIAIVHGWIYVVYLITVVDLWSKLRWNFGHLVQLVAAGVVPLLSFWAERKTTREVRAIMATQQHG